jgi:RNA-splicing ligase RtcB
LHQAKAEAEAEVALTNLVNGESEALELRGETALLPGNPCAGSVVMVVDPGAEKSAYSVNHGAGRCMGRKAADRTLDQKTVDDEFTTNDILTNCRLYPKDEAPAAYKDFDAILDSVKAAGLASEVARLKGAFCDQGFRHKPARCGLIRHAHRDPERRQSHRRAGDACTQ